MTQEKPYLYHAIIVLANLMDHGQLNDESRARMNMAAQAFAQKEAPCIITTGWDYHGRYPVPIALAMRDYAIRQYSIAPEAILCDTHARDTVGDAVFTKRNIVIPRGWKRLLVISSDYHAPRVLEIFSFIYGPEYTITVRGAPCPTTSQTTEQEQQSMQAFRKTFEGITSGDNEAIFDRLRQQHPLYNGITYPPL